MMESPNVTCTSTPAGKLPPDKLAYRVSEAAAAIGIGRSSLYELISEGKLKPVTIAGRRLVPRAELERLLSEAMAEAA